MNVIREGSTPTSESVISSHVQENQQLTVVKKKRYTKRQWIIFFVLALVNLFCAMVYSVQAPFFPREAEKKHATPIEYGFVFGVYELVDFIMCPIFGRFIRIIGPKFMLNAGNFVMASCCIMFGFINHAAAGTAFISLSFAVRIVEGLGQAGYLTASYAIIAHEFPDNLATTFSFLEMLFAVGVILGPSLGGFLYEVGGFTLPFAFVGGFLWLTALLTSAILPQMDESSGMQHSYWTLFKIPTVLISFYSVFAMAFSFGFLQVLLEPHIRQFGLSTVLVSLMFIINAAFYGLTSIVFGHLIDQNMNPKIIVGTGAVFVVTSFLLIGPAPFFPVKSSLWLVIVSLILHGVGCGAQYVAAFLDCNQTVIRSGFPNNTETYGMVAGLWTSTLALGTFIGPSVAGVMQDAVGFRNASMVVVGLHAVLALINFGHIAYEKKWKKAFEYEPFSM